MTQPSTDQRADRQLQALSELELRLCARVQVARAQAQALVEAARVLVGQRAAQEAAQAEQAALSDERADLERHQARRAALQAEHAATMRGLGAVTPERIDALAREALRQAIGAATGGSR